MLTSYLVRCPHLGCNWFGSVLPLDHPEAWSSSIPTVQVARFECPQCQGTWQARIVGDDVESLPLEEAVLPLA